MLGVNEDKYDPAKHTSSPTPPARPTAWRRSPRSCNDSSASRGLLTTVHAYTNSQRLLDVATKDLRDARARRLNIVPSSTGAARRSGW